ncbi:hypothetical protein [Haloplanus pelagicus]|uniref:hypothetical protein n=1 Tax=Haloplanus pelagicus TaxID=2949995 RepID=UPI00203CBC90|nr:hypothetical protein [Haloplanus sp. HW8-1]
MSLRSAADPPFRVVVAGLVRMRDCAALAAVPAAVLGIFLLPESRRQSLTFVYTDPSLSTAFTAHFVHFRVSHLASNLLGYVVFAGLSYLLATLADRRRLFGAATATYLLALPPVLSALNLAVPRRAVGYGFSGVTAAFAGLLAVLLPLYARSRLVPWVDYRHAPAVFFVVLAIATVVALPPSTTSLGVGLTCGLLGAYYVRALDIDRRRVGRPGTAGSTRGWLELFVVATVSCLGFPVVGFGAGTSHVATVPNDYVHLLGFCLGFLGPYVSLAVGPFGADRAADEPTG